MDPSASEEPSNKRPKLEIPAEEETKLNVDDDQPLLAPPKAEEEPSAPPQTTPTEIEPVRDTYCSREQRSLDRENSGELCAKYIWNNGQPESGKILIGLKNVFAKCLPNMPKTYIARLVFDRRHRSVVILRVATGKVIAGITYRPFHDRHFAEIAFCAVAQTLQVSGFGTRLMNWTKHYAREQDGIEYFLTYADNAAVGYFSKQGFTKTLTMPKERWHGYIKDYDGGTLMECYIHPGLPFTTIPEMIRAQRKTLDRAIQQYTTAHVVYPGLKRWKKEGDVGQLPLGDIPGVKEAGWTEASAAASSIRYQFALQGKLLPPTAENVVLLQRHFIEQLRAEKDLIWPFLEPVPKELVPDYYDVVKDPIDLKTIEEKVDKGLLYVTLDIFAADVHRMFKNAKFYNNADTPYYKAAHKLSILFSQWMDAAVHYDIA